MSAHERAVVPCIRPNEDRLFPTIDVCIKIGNTIADLAGERITRKCVLGYVIYAIRIDHEDIFFAARLKFSMRPVAGCVSGAGKQKVPDQCGSTKHSCTITIDSFHIVNEYF